MNQNVQLKSDILSPEQMMQDIDQFSDLYERVHPHPLDEFPVRNPGDGLIHLKDRLHAPLSRLEFYKILAPMINGTGDEHTHLLLPAQELKAFANQGGCFFPYDLKIMAGHAYLSSSIDGQDHGISPGVELVSINTLPISEILSHLQGFFSGTSDRQKEFFLENSFPEALYLGYGPATQFTVVTHAADGAALSSITLPGCQIVEVAHDTGFPVLNESPLRYRNDNQFQRIGPKTLLLEFRAFENTGGKFSLLIDDLFKTAKSEGRDKLVIDLRRNIGGDSFVVSSLLAYLASGPYELLESSELRVSAELKQHFLEFIPPLLRMLGVHRLHPWTRKLWQAEEGKTVSISFKPYQPGNGKRMHFDGRVIILSSPGDYSSSAILLGTIKHYGMGTIIGEPSGGYPTHYGNCTWHTLQNSRLEVLIPASTNHGKGCGPVLPDQEIHLSRADVAAGRDTVLEYAFELKESPEHK